MAAPPLQHPTTAVVNRIVNLINTSTCRKHIQQIQAQLIHRNLHSNTTVALHFITTCNTLSLLPTILPLFLNNNNRNSNSNSNSNNKNKPPLHLFTYNTLIKSFSLAQIANIPFSVYTHMNENSVAPNNFTYPFLLKSLSDSRDLPRGEMVHTHVVKLGYLSDVYVGNGLMDMYASCGKMALCRNVFDEMPEKDVVSWTVLIMGYRDGKKYDDALVAFERMQYEGVMPNRVTMVNVLGVCACIGAVEMGVWVHDFIRRSGWDVDVILGTSLVDMYLKCGRVKEGLSVFTRLKEKNIFTWNALIKGLALAKCGVEAVWFFDRMESEGFKLDEVTLVNVLSACSHSGLIDKGHQIFRSLLNGKYGFPPNVKHYACLVDILARAGNLDEAFWLIREMPFEPTKSIWGSLLAACRDKGNFELSEVVAKKLVELEPENSGYYVVLSNLYAEMGRWSDVANVREIMKERGVQKGLGCSSLEAEYQEYDYASVTP